MKKECHNYTDEREKMFGKESLESLVRQINDKRAREFVLEFWAQYKEWLQYGGTVPIWLASIESRVRDLVESIEKEGK